MQSHAAAQGAPGVLWSIFGLPTDDPDVPQRVALEDALRRCTTLGYPSEGLPLWRSRTVQAHLERHEGTLDSCAIEMRAHAITLFDFVRREVLSLLSPQATRDLERERVDASLLAPFFILFSALMLHSSAVVRAGGAAVFLAADEGGKTTVARTAPREAVLSDDQNVVRREAGSFRVHSTPWSLFLGPPRSAPLRAFFRIEKADRFEIIPLKAKDLVEYLWQEHRVPLLLLPRPLRAAAFELACDVSRAAPAFAMRFPRNYVDWDAVDRAMERG